VFTVAQYFEGRQVRLANMYFEQSLFDGRLSLKTGRFSTGSEFLTSPIDFSFVNEALNPILLAAQVNVPGVTVDPNVTGGGRVAVWNQLTANGTEFGITSAAGYFVVGEIGYLVQAENNAPGLPGRYRVAGTTIRISTLPSAIPDTSRRETTASM
jgi:carbohydrate-selective porin OprB